jgi:hypothetical protein
MEIVLFWLGLSIVVWAAASSKGRSGFGWFLLAIVISPLIAGLLVLVLPSRKPQAVTIVQAPQSQGSALKKCPECAEVVQADARICRFCRHEFYPAPAASPLQRQPDPNFKLPPV